MRPFLWYTAITPPFLFLSWVSQWQVPITKPLKSYLCSSWVLSWTAIGRNCKHVKKYIRFMVQSWKSHCEPGNAWMLHVNCFNKKGVIQPFAISFPFVCFTSQRQKCNPLISWIQDVPQNQLHYYPNLDPRAVGTSGPAGLRVWRGWVHVHLSIWSPGTEQR